MRKELLLLLVLSLSLSSSSPDGKIKIQRLNTLPRVTELQRARFRVWTQVCVTSSVTLQSPGSSTQGWPWIRVPTCRGSDTNMLYDLGHCWCSLTAISLSVKGGTASLLAPRCFSMLPLSEGIYWGLPCATHGSKHFTSIASFGPHSSTVWRGLI